MATARPGRGGSSGSSVWVWIILGALVGAGGIGVGIWKFVEAFTTKVEGSLSIVDDSGGQTFFPTTCGKIGGGQRYQLPDIALGEEEGGTGTAGTHLRLNWERRAEQRKVILTRQKTTTELTTRTCSVFDTMMDWSGGEAAGDKGVRGRIRLDCSVDQLQVKGEVRFDACYRP